MKASKHMFVVLLSVVVSLCMAPHAAFALGEDTPTTPTTTTTPSTTLTGGDSSAIPTAPAVQPAPVAKPKISYKAYSKGVGWTSGWKKAGKSVGKKSAQMRIIRVKVNNDGLKGSVSYRVKPVGKKWSKWTKNGKKAGVKGRAIRGIQIKLTGELAKEFDVAYRVYHDEQGWLPWVVNGRTAGCYGKAGINQMQVKLVRKGEVPELEDGAYVISRAKNYKDVLAISKSKLTDGARLVKEKYSEAAINERFYVWNETDGTISLQSIASGKFIKASGNKIVQGADTGTAASRWVLKSWNGGYVIANAANGKKLNLSGAKTVAGKTNTRWMFSPVNLVGNGSYSIVNSARGKLLDVEDMDYSNKANVDVASEDPDYEGAQVFTFKHKGSEIYRIDCAGTLKTLEVAGGSKKDGANVRQMKWKSSNAQKWVALFDRSCGLQFKNYASGKVLTALSGGKNGANVVSKGNSKAKTQSWALTPATFEANIGLIRAVEKAEDMSSSTNYLIMVDLTNHWLTIFTGSRGHWVVDRDWQVTNGKSSTPTVVGNFTVGDKGYSFGGGHTCYYWTQFYGNYLFHSVLYYEGTHRIMDGRLGRALSMGCVRMTIGHAKWIYDNIPRGTRVKTFR